jgi:hypothetical protein
MDSTGYDIAMGFHLGAPAGWSVALGAERYQRSEFQRTTFLLIEPGKHADRVSVGTGTETGADLATALAANIRASFLRVRTSSPHVPAGNYGGAEVQLLFLGVGGRLGVFTMDLRHRPMVTLDASLSY